MVFQRKKRENLIENILENGILREPALQTGRAGRDLRERLHHHQQGRVETAHREGRERAAHLRRQGRVQHPEHPARRAGRLRARGEDRRAARGADDLRAQRHPDTRSKSEGYFYICTEKTTLR